MSTAPDAPVPLEQDRWLELPQGRIFARRWRPAAAAVPPAAAGAPIVLLHDSLGCVEMWRQFPQALCRATGREVLAYDRLGFGRSTPRDARPSSDFVAEEAALYLPAILDQLDVRRFVALGHSVGGGMAIHAAARFGSACEALITMAAQAFVEELTRQGIRTAREQFKNPAQFARLARYHEGRARWALDAWIETWLSPAFADWSMAPVLPQVGCPVLAIHGERDEYASIEHARRIGALSAGPAQVELLAEVGHFPHREQEDRVVALIAAFLAKAVP